MRRRFYLLIPVIVFLSACSTEKNEKNTGSPLSLNNAGYEIKMNFAPRPWSVNADTLFMYFRIVDTLTQKKVIWDNLKETSSIVETGGNPPKKGLIKKITDKTIKRELISQHAVFWLVVDRTILENEMSNLKETILNTVKNLPDSTVYISFFDEEITASKLITKDNFDDFQNDFAVKDTSKNLYQAILQKFDELTQYDKELGISRYLLVFTDGKINASDPEKVEEVVGFREQIKKIDDNRKNNVQIHAFRYGKSEPLVDMTLEDICGTKGTFYSIRDAASIINSLHRFMGDLSADYELMLINNPGKIYYGQDLTLRIEIKKDNNRAAGLRNYRIGSKERPIETNPANGSIILVIMLGGIILFITFFVIQAGIPYITSKFVRFEKKYVRSYEPIQDVLYEPCAYCGEPLEKGEKVVVKCIHKTHWQCWVDNGYKCVEYGQNCKDGIQFHFDKNKPFDLKQSPYYMKWVMSGMFGGFLVWIIYSFIPNLFSGFITGLLNVFYPGSLKEEVSTGIFQISYAAAGNFQQKISGFLLVGILLGFILTFLFGYINEFRKKRGVVLLSITGRALLGATAGFLSFLIGSIICIMLGKDGNAVWIDLIPWLLFGGSVAVCLSINTTIGWKDALIGGIISGVVSSFVLYTASLFPSFGVMFSFMLCSAGLGISIIVKHHASQKYFLTYKGEKKEGEIAIHKWMDESGGGNNVTIGKSGQSIIQMNWDSSEKIHDTQAKLYIDKKRKVPYLKVMENGMTCDGRETKKDDLHPLKNGLKFTIGNTEFTYVER